MTGFATLADLRAAERLYANAQQATQSAENENTWTLAASALPTVATTPGTVHTNGSPLFNLPDTGTAEKYLTEWMLQTQSNVSEGTYALYDRLVSVSQLITTTGVKTINSAALTRYTTGVGVSAWVEVSTVTATNAVVLNLNSYTDQSGNTGHSGASITFPSTALNVGSWIQLPLQAGDYGVRSVESINVTTASGGSGTINVVLAYCLTLSGVGSGQISAVAATLNNYVVPIRVYDGCHFASIVMGYAGGERTSQSITVALA